MFCRFEDQIINSIDVDLKNELVDLGYIVSNNITDLLEVNDIGTNKFGTVFMYRDPVHKDEFLRLCNKLYFKCDKGYLLFTIKGDDDTWVYYDSEM